MLELEDFKDFCQLMFDSLLSRSNRVFTAGSQAEVKGNEESIKLFCRNNTMDVDYMMYSRDAYVFKEYDEVPPDYRGLIIRYTTEGIHPGYVRLSTCDDGEYRFDDIAGNIQFEQLSNELLCHVTSKNDEKMENDEDIFNYNRVGPAYKSKPLTHNVKKFKLHVFNTGLLRAPNACDIDQVIARHSPYWPREAAEWITRQRPHGSLLHDATRRVVAYGCDFVCVSHKGYIENDKDQEWRFSFSMAELILIKNWSRQQRVVYRTIRVLHKYGRKEKVKSQLCVYHFKTLMLWAVETKAKCFWEDAQLLDSVSEVFKDMIHCLKTKCLAHYFIPANNLFDHQSIDSSNDIKYLTDISTNSALIFDVLEYCQDEEAWNTKRKLFISIPPLLYNNLVAATHLTNEYLSASERLCLKLDDAQNFINSELKTVYALVQFPLTGKCNEGFFCKNYISPEYASNKSDKAALWLLNCNKESSKITDFFSQKHTKEIRRKDRYFQRIAYCLEVYLKLWSTQRTCCLKRLQRSSLLGVCYILEVVVFCNQ